LEAAGVEFIEQMVGGRAMQLQHVPRLDARYWVTISCTSVFGANMGDFISHILGLGHIAGLPWLAAVFAAIMVTERCVRFETEAFYWVAIVTVRTAATNLADLATHDLRLDYRWVIAGSAAVLVVVLMSRRDDQAREGLPSTGPL
jgi:uncharacterized membrane-anchored protein